MKPAVLDRQSEFFHQEEKQLEFLVGKVVAGHPVAENGHAKGALAIGDRNGDMAVEDLEFALDLGIESAEKLTVFGAGPQDMVALGQAFTDPRIAREFKAVADVEGNTHS